jgi:hypothetical protein
VTALGWQTVSAMDETFGADGTLASLNWRQKSAAG